ncbi:MAG: creatininase family protein [Candidatus Hydrogenedens sp.]|nr:creatininase family protein [Candidatus Hydrogenedentota bacterium]NLF58002.1 creatininase family protein [Candidatus Hydrogenedens sp.]
MRKEHRFEKMRPRDLARVLEQAPVAFVPLGTLEFHGWHLPFGFDALKALDLCERVAAKTGGAVLPPAYTGFGGGHRDFEGSILQEEAWTAGMLGRTCDRLIGMGFRVLVLLTGHYPEEQVAAVQRAAREAMERHPGAVVLGLAEPQAYPGEFRGDHAAKWETSIAMHLMPEKVDLRGMESHDDPLYGIGGEDPRETASAALGRETVDTIVDVLAAQVREALTGRAPKPPWYYHNRENP